MYAANCTRISKGISDGPAMTPLSFVEFRLSILTPQYHQPLKPQHEDIYVYAQRRIHQCLHVDRR